ncbi:MAG: MurR/RpiR family transcriptional regulator [Armatimonadota bacterium]|nr:MurR/RpiR family transcriptional regulator [Armatimonadota bacterium]MDR7488526.1 MurR/RpiR family transcriptional regulator [Armatimonadota bacterium]MDR7573783.1 MurR/RpiR family transcriptional regulator [Armatimonadota bacterium]MDR7586530.1 MurR/RpiR family transcriptional regulator [Armatimonadota bacterium]
MVVEPEVTLDFFQRVRDRYADLSPSFRKVADYLLANYRDAAFLPASRVAMLVDVSESVVVRFAAALGYSGYPEMLRAMQRIVKSELAPARRLTRDESGALTRPLDENDSLHRVIAQDIDNLNLTANDPVTRTAFEKAAQLLTETAVVYCLGLRGLGNLAGLLGFLLNLGGKRSHIITHGDATLFEQLYHIEAADVLVAFAFQRYTRRTVEALEFAKKRGARTVTITDSLASPAAQIADVALVAHVKSRSFFNSYVAAVSLINALVTSVVAQKFETAREALERIEELLPEEDFLARNG